MQFKFVDKILDSLKLKLPELEVLQKDSNPYRTLLYQHKGVIKAQKSFIGNADSAVTAIKFHKFLEKAKDEEVELAATPEYSCPWSVIASLIEARNSLPSPGKLWVLGCESISIVELQELEKKAKGKSQLKIYFDRSILTSSRNFLDPICYIFKTINNKTQNHTTLLLIQFKTQHMGVWTNDLERNNLIRGKEVYVLRNDPNSINLFTLICSDIEQFNIDSDFKNQLDNRWDENPFIILNLQLNPKPRDELFRNFRNEIFDRYENKELIFLNWSKDTKIEGTKNTFVQFSASSIQTKSNEISHNKDLFHENHRLGLYYTFKGINLHVYYLNSSEHIFIILNLKPSQAGTYKSMRRLSGPRILRTSMWDASLNEFTEIRNDVNDGCLDFLKSIGCGLICLKENDLNVLDKERLVNISCGLIKYEPRSFWYDINRLETMRLDEKEIIKRITFAEDNSPDASKHRNQCIDNLQILNFDILQNDSCYPASLSLLKGKCKGIMFRETDSGQYDYNHNLVSTDQKHFATVAYVGVRDIADARNVFSDLQRILNDQSKKRVVVWYKHGNDYLPVYDPNPPSVTDDHTIDPDSIIKE